MIGDIAMKKINLDIIFKLIILIGFSAFFIDMIIEGEVIKYVHPRLIPVIIFGIISMLIILFFMFNLLYTPRKNKFKLENYIIFLVPLFMIFLSKTTYKSTDTNLSLSNTSNNYSNNSSDYSDSNSTDDYTTITFYTGDDNTLKNKLDISNDVININSKNLFVSLNEITSNIEMYENKEINIDGFVYKDNRLNLPSNQFVIGRYMMVCCAADMQITGLQCQYSDISSYDNNTYVKITGKLTKTISNNEEVPLIIVESIINDDSPDKSYVYPQ